MSSEWTEVGLLTTADVAQRFRCSRRKVWDLATSLGVGANLGGPAGWRFTEQDVAEMLESMRPEKPVKRQRRAG